MRILFLTPRRIDDPRSGGTIKSAALLSFLERDHEVDVAAFRAPDADPWQRPNGETVTVPIERGRTGMNLARSYAAGVPLSIQRNRSREMRSQIERLTADRHHDVAFVDGWLMAQDLPEDFPGIRLLHEHNAEYVMWQRHAALETRRARRTLVRFEAGRVRRYERSILERFETVFVVSEPDRRALLELGEAPEDVRVLPNVPDPELAERPSLNPAPDPVLLFFATLSWPPNAEGLTRFIAEGFPPLLERIPKARLVVAGSGAPDALIRLAQRARGVEYAGPADDDERLYRRARCFVDVAVGGSGSRVKVLNALARGLPVVTTGEGAEGLDVLPGEHLLVADRPETMAGPAARVLTDEALWTSLANAGRALIRDRYVPEVAFAELATVLRVDQARPSS
jgi:glycosyltransferase involved in cell wall biosynthesis